MNAPIRYGLTFDDVLLVPKRFNGSSRSQISTTSRFSRNIAVNIPIVSSNMDTVTESPMAIALAREGGIGIIHRFMTIQEQVKEVEIVKRAETIIIEKPYTLSPDTTLAKAIDLMIEKGVSGILITSGDNSLEGILTRRDLRFVTDYNKLISEVMTPKSDLIVAPANITLDEAKNILEEHKIEKLPLVSHGKLTGLITASDINKKDLYKNATKDEKGRLRVGAAIGVKSDALSRAHALLEVGVDTLVVDIAHGHSDLAINTVKELRREFGNNIDICAGNVATAEGTEDLISNGVDSIKVGIGPGSICVTRIVTGAGVPQLTAIMDCAEIARNYNVPVIADGGIRTSGDIVKALAAGASTVMIGNLFAGTTESPGSPIIRNGRRYKIIRGMASLGASLGRESRERKGSFDKDDMDDFAASVVPEGVEAMVPFRGSVKEVITQLVGGIRSGISYCGSLSVLEMQEKSEFIQISNAGIKESNAHDVESV